MPSGSPPCCRSSGWPSAPSRKQGTIQIHLESPVDGATVSIDGQALRPEQLKAPLTLPVGPHRLEAGGDGLVAFSGSLPVFEGANEPFPVKLTALPKPVPPASKAEPEAKPEPTEVVAATAEPGAATGPTDPAEAQPAGPETPASGVMEAADMPSADPAEKPEGDVPVVADIPDELPDPKGQRKPEATLKQIVSDPESYLDTSVIPSDLVMITTNLARASKKLAVRSGAGAYQNLKKPGTSFEIVIKPELAAILREQVKAGNLVAGDYPAIVKFKVVKDPEDAKDFLGAVEWLEFLVYVDPRPISKKSSFYNKAFTVIKVAEGGAQVGHSPSYKEWQKRLNPTGLIARLKKIYNQAFEVDRGQEFDKWAALVRTNLPKHAKTLHDRMMGMIR